MRKMRLVALCSALSLFGTGCFGSFPLVTKLYKFNKGVGDKWVQTLVFWALGIIPVYGVAGFIDVFILNLVEFWTGNNPVSATLLEDGSMLETERLADDTLRIRRTVDGQVISEHQIVKLGENAGLVRDADGAVLSTIEALSDGSFAVGGPAGVRLVTPAEAGTLFESAERGTLAVDAARLLQVGEYAVR